MWCGVCGCECVCVGLCGVCGCVSVCVCVCVSLIVVRCNNSPRKGKKKISWMVNEGKTGAVSNNAEVAKAVDFG